MSLHTNSPLRFFAVIPCAGFGSRAGTAMPKQYQAIAGLPIVVHTLKAFAGVQRIAKGVLVLAPDDVHMDGVLAVHPQPLFETSRTGGAKRAESVLAGLRELVQQGAHDTDWVLVHDAARCLVTPEQINALIDACQDDAVGGLLAHKLADTLKVEANGRVAQTVDRADKWLAQTPQMFRAGLLLQALTRAMNTPAQASIPTDEAQAMEALGYAPILVRGSGRNTKITWPEDFKWVESWL